MLPVNEGTSPVSLLAKGFLVIRGASPLACFLSAGREREGRKGCREGGKEGQCRVVKSERLSREVKDSEG